jgi:hypothetical protein
MPDELEATKAELKALGLDGHFISSHTRAGVDELLDILSVNAQEWKKHDSGAGWELRSCS